MDHAYEHRWKGKSRFQSDWLRKRPEYDFTPTAVGQVRASRVTLATKENVAATALGQRGKEARSCVKWRTRRGRKVVAATFKLQAA